MRSKPPGWCWPTEPKSQGNDCQGNEDLILPDSPDIHSPDYAPVGGAEEKFEDVVKPAEQAAVLVLVY